MTTPATRVAIVTGGSGGIGRAVAERLGAEHFDVVVHYSGNADKARQTAGAVSAAGGRALTVKADVADESEVAALFDAAVAEFGGVDVVVHTAGIMPLGPIAEMDLADFDQVQRTNVRGTFVVDQAAARTIRDGGSIVNFSTSVTRLQQPGYGAYAASKGAVEALTLILARELRGRDVTVNAVAPGPTATPLFLDGKPQEVVDHLASLAPLERLGTPDDIAQSVLSLVDARWINGQVVYVNGGIA
ncbi:SDR family oxidoreductase [Oerskovia sp. NPDC056781]|uniref:SDR family oxidoreductase n=1 Tax=Oerskovia rustica TaxID=2762237 RepID=A0ABR8RVH3_9CELL|nr:SDR family oxidoreductase [Oerskovia rustica]MBD7951781.1 SDR family oxidoreductase [Oerskovia rustica]